MDLKTYLDERLVFIHYREKNFFFVLRPCPEYLGLRT